MNESSKSTEQVIFCEFSGKTLVLVLEQAGKLRLMSLDFPSPRLNLAQSQMLPDTPYHLVASYLQTAVLGLLWQPAPRRVGMVGLGGGCLVSFLHHYFPEVCIEVAEIDPMMVKVAQQFFRLPQDERVEVVVADGRFYLSSRPPAQYDWLLIDAFDSFGRTPHPLLTQQFYEVCRPHLAESGVLIVNMLNEDTHYWDRMYTLRHIFEHTYFCRLDEGNTVLFASQGMLPPLVELVKKAAVLDAQHAFSFHLAPWASLLHPIPDIENGRILVDDTASL